MSLDPAVVGIGAVILIGVSVGAFCCYRRAIREARPAYEHGQLAAIREALGVIVAANASCRDRLTQFEEEAKRHQAERDRSQEQNDRQHVELHNRIDYLEFRMNSRPRT
jgi:hypothetical protein